MGRIDRQRRWSRGGASGWAAFESFRAATHVLTGEGLIVEANPAFERMFGASRKTFYGCHHADLCDGPHAARQRLTSRIIREASSRGGWQGNLVNRRSDGRRFTTQAHVYPTRVDGDHYFVCIQEESGRSARGESRGIGEWTRRNVGAPG